MLVKYANTIFNTDHLAWADWRPKEQILVLCLVAPAVTIATHKPAQLFHVPGRDGAEFFAFLCNRCDERIGIDSGVYSPDDLEGGVR